MKAILIAAGLLIMIGSWQVWAKKDLGIPYQKEPRSNLTVGGQPTLEQLESLKKRGYTTIINLRREGEFGDFNEATEVQAMGLEYVHIPIKNVEAITVENARALHEAISNASGPVLLHCTVGWRAGSLFAIENFLIHDVSEAEALDLVTAAHMDHAVGDVQDWLEIYKKSSK
ncbi:MAG: hypothetical protein ACI9H8_000994 [Lysobacterales bacterium]|jgi:uncharacterized protein (TIGR01244 family)